MTTTFDDPHIECRNEYDALVDVYFKGSPFTGTIVDGLETINYKEGQIHGQYIIHYNSGSLRSNELYENGEIVSSVTYYENGQKESELLNGSYCKWTDKGALIQKDKEHYFENGKQRAVTGGESDNFAMKYLAPDGSLICTQKKDVWQDNQYGRIVEYDHELMYEWYYELLNEVINDDSQKYMIHLIWMWFWEIFEQDQHKYFKIVNSLLVHPNIEVVKCIANIIAIHRFHSYIEPESKENAQSYAFIREYTKYQNERFPDRETRIVDL